MCFVSLILPQQNVNLRLADCQSLSANNDLNQIWRYFNPKQDASKLIMTIFLVI